MTLFSSLSTALTGLQASMTALQTTGHNIANANTPGYSRQTVDLRASTPLELPGFSIGRGVTVAGVQRTVDQELLSQLQDANATLSSLGAQNDSLTQLQSVFGALSNADLGTQMDQLFTSIQNFTNNPSDLSTREAVLGDAATVAQSMNGLNTQITQMRSQLNNDVKTTVGDINSITQQIALLNQQIVAAEHGGLEDGSANDLRDQRDQLLQNLSQDIKITAVETSNGNVNVLAGSTFLVFNTQSYNITTKETADNGVIIDTPVLEDKGAPVPVDGGKLQGLIQARDGSLATAGQQLNILANSFAYEFNRVQSTGQGLQRFTDLTSEQSVHDPTTPIALAGTVTSPSTLDTLTDSSLIGAANPTGQTIQILSGQNQLEVRQITGFDPTTGTLFFDRPLPEPLAVGDSYQIKDLPFPVSNGSFDVVMTNEVTGLQQSFTVNVDLNRAGAQTSWNDIVSQLNGVPNLTAQLTSDNHIHLKSSSSDVTFSFANDTSGFLAAAGLNTFFTGSGAGDIAVNSALTQNPQLLSGAQSNNPGDNSNALAFAGLQNLASTAGGSTFDDYYRGLVGSIGVQASDAHDQLSTQQALTQQLQNQRDSVSGVNIDEEAVNLIQYQRSFQASARFTGVIDELLNTLITSV
jgi:flagellar hook-associated protein 1 FlgK